LIYTYKNYMDKRHAHHYFTRLRTVPVVLLLASALVFALIGVFALRANNLKMLDLRQAVFVADEQNGDVEAALKSLREHVYGHMNTDLTAGSNGIYPPIQLKHRYERLVAAEKDRVGSHNAQVANDAQNLCEQRFPGSFSGGTRVPCVREYIDANSTSETPIPEGLYQFDFESPGWSPDLAGWSLVLSAMSMGIAIIVFVSERWLRHYIRRHA
jgi:hypothetical protein